MQPKEIQELINFIVAAGLEEVSIETDQLKLSIKKGVPVLPEAAPVPQLAPAQHAAHHTILKSPLVGTFYRALDLHTNPLVIVGAYVKKGQKICVIETMKIFNEVEADATGTIVEILVEDGSPVAYDEPLFVIDPIR